MARVLITGAAGFIGMHTAIKFIDKGWNVIGLDNVNNYYSVDLKRSRLLEIYKKAESCQVEFIMFEQDLNSNVWIELLKVDIDAVIHLAAQAGVRYSLENPEAYIQSNILGFQKVLDFVTTKDNIPFCYASSSSVYGKNSIIPFSENQTCNEPESYYAATKKANEMMAFSYFKTRGLKSVGLRFFTVYGPYGRPDMAPMIFTKAAFEKKAINVFNYGKQKRDFTYVDDIVEGIMLVIDSYYKINRAEILNIGCGKPTDLIEFISMIERKTGLKIEKKFIQAQKGDVVSTYADSTRLQNLTGYLPKTDLNEGISNFISWYKKYYKI